MDERRPEIVMVRIEGEPFLSRAKAYREAFQEWRVRWSEFAISKGADGHVGTAGLTFHSGQQPEGWLKPNSRGFSRPKKNHPDLALLSALPPEPRTALVFGESIIMDCNHEGPGKNRGSRGIGYFFRGLWVGWLGNTFYAKIPHARNAAQNTLSDYPGCRITTEGALEWDIPSGLVEITEAEYRFDKARHDLEEERATSPAPQVHGVFTVASDGGRLG